LPTASAVFGSSHYTMRYPLASDWCKAVPSWTSAPLGARTGPSHRSGAAKPLVLTSQWSIIVREARFVARPETSRTVEDVELDGKRTSRATSAVQGASRTCLRKRPALPVSRTGWDEVLASQHPKMGRRACASRSVSLKESPRPLLGFRPCPPRTPLPRLLQVRAQRISKRPPYEPVGDNRLPAGGRVAPHPPR